MAIFGWKKTEGGKDGAAAGAGGAGGGGAVGAPGAGAATGNEMEFSPEKAERWFHYARTSHDTSNYEYAAVCWLSGLRFQPNNLDGIKGFFGSASASAQNGGTVTKALHEAVAGKSDVHRFLAALLAFAFKTGEADAAVRAVAAAGHIALTDVVNFLAPVALKIALNDKRVKKDHFVKLMEACKAAGSFELAVRAGEEAVRLAPEDNRLSAEVRNLAAQGTMTRGGYDQTGQEGGFRANIRDAEKQRQLDEGERTGRSENVLDRQVTQAKEEYEARPTDRPAIKKYAAALVNRKKAEDLQLAYDILMKGYQETQEFRFRQDAGAIRIAQAMAKMKPLREAAAASPADAAAQATLMEAQKQLLALEISEFEARTAAYPTELAIKFELGRRYFDVGRFDDAIDLLQQAKDEAKNRASALSYLGRAFAAKGWHEEAIGTFRLALEGHPDLNDAGGMELRYGLMCSLQQHAEENKDLPSAEEAGKIAGDIVVRQISFKDVRGRRDSIKALIAKLKSGG